MVTFPRNCPTGEGNNKWDSRDLQGIKDFIEGASPTGNFKAIFKFIVYEVTGVYYANNSWQLVYGGTGDEGGVDGDDIAAVQQAAIDNAGASGIVYLKGMALDAGVTLVDGVLVVEDYNGILHYKFSNPTSETPMQTNANVQAMSSILATPTNVPSAEAWAAFSSEIIGAAGFAAGKALVAAYFGAKAIAAENVWAINPLCILSPTSSGNSIVVEVDLANQQADGVGIGVASYLGEAAGAAAGDHKDGLYAFHAKDNCTVAGIGWQYGFVCEDPLIYGAYIAGDPSTAFFGGDVSAGGNADLMQFKTFANPSFWVTYDPILKLRKYTPEGAPVTGNVLQGFLAAEVEPRCQITHSGIYFGAGGASSLDVGLYRNSANQWLTPDNLTFQMANSTDAAISALADGDGQYRFYIRADGSLFWGDGSAAQDCSLSRNAANQLLTPDQIIASDGLATKYKAGALSDADFTATYTGLIGIDTSNNRIYFRVGAATWKYCAADGGFQIVKEETTCTLCNKSMLKGQAVTGLVEGEMSDGALHAVYVHLKCAIQQDK